MPGWPAGSDDPDEVSNLDPVGDADSAVRVDVLERVVLFESCPREQEVAVVEHVVEIDGPVAIHVARQDIEAEGIVASHDVAAGVGDRRQGQPQLVGRDRRRERPGRPHAVAREADDGIIGDVGSREGEMRLADRHRLVEFDGDFVDRAPRKRRAAGGTM